MKISSQIAIVAPNKLEIMSGNMSHFATFLPPILRADLNDLWVPPSGREESGDPSSGAISNLIGESVQ